MIYWLCIFYVPLENKRVLSWRDIIIAVEWVANFRPMLGACVNWAWRDFYRDTCFDTRPRFTPSNALLNSLVQQARGPGPYPHGNYVTVDFITNQPIPDVAKLEKCFHFSIVSVLGKNWTRNKKKFDMIQLLTIIIVIKLNS